MKRNNLPAESYLDLLFHGRNKAYGGYELRQHYDERLKKAMLTALLGIVGWVMILWITKKPPALLPQRHDTPTQLTGKIKIVPDHPKAERKVEPALKAKTYAATPPRIVPDKTVTPQKTTPRDPDAIAGAKNESEGHAGGAAEGSINGTGNISKGTDSAGIGGGTEPKKAFVFVEQMPQFPGGVAQLQKWLQSHLQFPARAREANQEGKVYVRFVVNEDGSISNIEVLQHFGYGSAEEAERVLRAMPRWLPGKQNGRAVKVLFNLPLTFRLE